MWKEALLMPNVLVEITRWTQQAAGRDEATHSVNVRASERVLQARRVRRGNGCRCRACSRLAPRILPPLAAATCNTMSRDDQLDRERPV